jgi:hypothetical protein
MSVKVGFAYGRKPSSTLTKLFTGSTCYHVFFVDEGAGRLYDMNLLRRRRLWPHYPPERVILADCPVDVPADYMEHMLDIDEATYGWRDYLLFALRPLYHLVGKSTRNVGGVICSEMVANDLIALGWRVRFPEVPSPADLEIAILGRKDAING